MPTIYKNTIIIGDIKINLLDSSIHSQNCQSLLNNNGFLSMINIPTRITPETQSRIDYIFIRQRNIVIFETAICDINTTDNLVLPLTLKDKQLERNNSIKPTTKSVTDYCNVIGRGFT